MLRTLLESQAVQARRTGGTLISVGVHTAIIALAIVATARATSAPPRLDPPKVTEVIFTRSPIRTEAPTHSQQQGRFAWHRVEIDHVVPPLKIPPELPPIDASRSAIDERSIDWGHAQLGQREPGGLAGPRDGIYKPDQVEKAVVPQAGNPAPAYPAQLRSAQIEGSVVARFVVDTTGLAEPASITFPEATHAQFAEAVRQALLRSRYLPAIVGDRRVRQLVEQRFAFTLSR